MKILYEGSDTRGQNRSNKYQRKWAFDSLDRARKNARKKYKEKMP